MTKTSPTLRFFGELLMAVGGLVAGLSGLCSLTVLGYTMSAALSSSAGGIAILGAMLVMVLVTGGPFVALGVGMFLWGRSLRG